MALAKVEKETFPVHTEKEVDQMVFDFVVQYLTVGFLQKQPYFFGARSFMRLEPRDKAAQIFQPCRLLHISSILMDLNLAALNNLLRPRWRRQVPQHSSIENNLSRFLHCCIFAPFVP